MCLFLEVLGGAAVKFFNSFKFKLILILAIIALVPLVALSLYQMRQLDSMVTSGIKSEEMSIVNGSVGLINSWMDSKISQLNEIEKNIQNLRT